MKKWLNVLKNHIDLGELNSRFEYRVLESVRPEARRGKSQRHKHGTEIRKFIGCMSQEVAESGNRQWRV